MNIQERIEKLEKELAKLKDEAIVKTWEPRGGEFFIDGYGEVVQLIPTWESKEFGTERHTNELAERASAMMRRFNRLLAYHDEFCPEHDPAGAWDGSYNNYSVYMFNKKWDYINTSYNDKVTVYFPEDIAEELCRKLNSGEVVL